MNHSSSSSTTLTLRPFKLSDADDLLQYAGDDQVTRFLRWETLTTRDEAYAYPTDGVALFASTTGPLDSYRSSTTADTRRILDMVWRQSTGGRGRRRQR
ncbi:hypothetical protein L6452_01491 [Arctium lappa]|uniref:Uncharacterized protein n=1 Tax=Arctium lappa TaxID=4217 RepID=A0ACB9FH14_ARCLA|nr:hypothetical protein L6452_01491 [Arctium lappa]